MENDIPLKTSPPQSKTAYSVIDLRQVKALSKLGLSDAEMADFFGVTVRSWREWRASYPEFEIALDSWREDANAKVERKLFERAVGHTVEEEILAYDKEIGDFARTKTLKYYPPDVKAQQYWLNNHAPEKYKNKQEVEMTGDFAQRLIDARRRLRNEAARGEDFDFLK
jgi:hypothetical protein